MGVTALLVLGFFAFITFRFTTPQMAPLYTGLNFDDSAAIVEELRSSGVPFELRGEGEAILVPRDQVTTLRMTLAQSGLPTSGQVGYEIFDKQNTLGATSFVQNINQIRALEGELARTITALARIKSARVHLVLPQRELFRRDTQEPSAAIMVSTRGDLSNGEIRAIQQLVASSIENLNTNRVSIVDDKGRLLASGAGTDEQAVLAGQFEERTLGVEQRLRGRVEDILANVVGAGRARVQVAAQLDTSQLTRTSETYDPNGQVVRSTQTRDTANISSTGGDQQGVSVSGQLPGGGGNGSGAPTGDQAKTTEETVNYEISRTTETQVDQAGGIKRLSIAVVVDGVYTQDANGNPVYNPRTPDEIAQLTTLVKSAVGFDQNRGDTVEVVNMQFAEPPGTQIAGTSSPGMFDFTRDDIMNWANMGVTLLIALALMLFVLRPLIRRVLEPESEPLALPQSSEIPAEVEPQGPIIPTPQPPGWVDKAKHLGEAQMETVKSVGTLIEENPKQATVILRDWLSQAA